MKSGYGQQVWNTIRGDRYRAAIVFFLNIFFVGEVKEATLNAWIGGLKTEAMKSKLHGCLLWSEYSCT
jgi:hypothetical protein